MIYDNPHHELIQRCNSNRQMARGLAARTNEAHHLAHLLHAQSATVRDDATQLHLALKLMRHWREFESQRRNP